MNSTAVPLRFLLLGAALSAWLPSVACAKGDSAGQVAPTASAAPAPVVRQARGVIRAISDEGRTIKIKHEEIQGYMAAMTMPFRAESPSLASGLKVGDAVQFSFHEKDGEPVLDGIQKVADAPPQP